MKFNYIDQIKGNEITLTNHLDIESLERLKENTKNSQISKMIHIEDDSIKPIEKKGINEKKYISDGSKDVNETETNKDKVYEIKDSNYLKNHFSQDESSRSKQIDISNILGEGDVNPEQLMNVSECQIINIKDLDSREIIDP